MKDLLSKLNYHLMSKYSILIADDHELILKGLQDFLSTIETIKKVDSAQNYKEILFNLEQNKYDFVFLDIHFGNEDGRNVGKFIRKNYPLTKLIALTSFNDLETIQSTINAGFNAFFLKSDDLNEIKQWLLAEDFEQVYISSSAKNIYTQFHLIKDSKEIHSISISQKEKEVLTLIMEEFTTKQIAEKMFLSQKTIEGYRANLMHKLDVTNIAGLVKKTILLGLLNQQ